MFVSECLSVSLPLVIMSKWLLREEPQDISNQVELTNENIQGIVSLRLKRDQIKGETHREILQKLNPTVVLKDVNKDK